MKRANLLLSCLSFCLLALEATGSVDGPSGALTRRAIELGMGPAELGELWRTKQPVIISKPDALGQLYTTTYYLSPDGKDIQRTSVKEQQLPPPDANVESITSSTTSTPPAVQPTNPQTEWEYVPPPAGNRRTYTPFFGGTFPQLNHNWHSFGVPAGVTPQTTTKTELEDKGRTVTTTIRRFNVPLIGGSWSLGTDVSANWPSFSFPAGVQPQTSTKTEVDDQGRTVTTHTKTWSTGGDGGAAGAVPASWQPDTNNIFAPSLPPWFNNPQFFGNVPSLRPSLRPSAAQPEPTLLPLPVPVPTRPTVVSMPPLPTAASKPLPPLESGESTPRTIAYYNVDALPTGTRVTSYSGSFNGGPPTKINDEDIRNAQEQGNVVSQVIRTMVRLNSSPPPEAAPPPAAVRPTPDNKIDNFLAQVNLTPEDLQAQNGEVIKTIVDQNGRVLNVRFVLSSIKGTDEQGLGQYEANKPTK